MNSKTFRHLVSLGLVVVVVVLAIVPTVQAQSQFLFQIIPPDGPYPVGRMQYLWVDETRPEVHTIDDETDQRELLVEVWYPAAPAEDAMFGPYMEPEMADLFSVMYGLPEGSVDLIASNAFPDAPLADALEQYPVLVLSPGFSAAPRQYSVLIEEMASYGYVVFAVSHPYVTTMTVFPDGRVIELINYNRMATLWAPRDVYDAEFTDVWVPDVMFVLDQITALNADDPDGIFTGRLLADRVGLMGHSQGARTISEACFLDARCAAAVNMDGGHSVSVDLGFDKPFMQITADNGITQFINAYEYSMEGLGQDYYVIMIPDTHHNSFLDEPYWLPLFYEDLRYQTDTLVSQYALLDYRLYIRSFFDRYVLEQEVPLLDGPSEDNPEVFFLKPDAPVNPPTAGAVPRVAVTGSEANRGEIEIGTADVWTYAGQAGEVLDIMLLADNPAGQTTTEQRQELGLLDTVLVVRAPDGSLLASNDDDRLSTNSLIDGLELPTDGEYVIEVRSYDNLNAGWYTLLVDTDRVSE
ncbi:MAG: hypothetical protein GYB65_04140 [Chloroflexi bacterium]|nr:hypothetical protein [Chloroflexota bacterium]